MNLQVTITGTRSAIATLEPGVTHIGDMAFFGSVDSPVTWLVVSGGGVLGEANGLIVLTSDGRIR